MDDPNTLAGHQLNIAHRHRGGWAVVEIAGALQWPPATQLAEFIPSTPTAILLDLTAVTSIDSTGIAVLASIAADLTHAGRRVHVVVTDEQLRRKLPRTAGLRHTFTSIDDATRSGAGTPETRPRSESDEMTTIDPRGDQSR